MRRNIVFCYHALSASWDVGLSARPEMLRRHLEILLARGYRPATLTQLIGAPARTGLFAITFDDAFHSVFALGLPILRDLGVPATLFVPTDYIEAGVRLSWPGIDQWADGPSAHELEPMSWDQITELADAGWEIGAHSCSHPRLTMLTDERLADELGRSRQVCEARLGRPCTSMAYPYGDVDDRVVLAARDAGYTAAGALPGAFDCADALQWPRIGIYQRDDERRFRLKTSLAIEQLRSRAVWEKLVSTRNRRAVTADRTP